MADQFYFDAKMQDLLLACICEHASSFAVVGQLVLPEYFWGVDATKTAAALQDFHAERGEYPTLDILDGYLREQYGREKADLYEQAHEYVETLRDLDTRNYTWVRDMTVKFCRERAIIVAIRKAADLVKMGKVPEGGFAQMFDQAMRVGMDINDLGIDFAGDSDRVIDMLTAKTYGVKTGFGLLDENWINGWCPGWLIVPLAPPKSYKSTFCVNLALNMIKGHGNKEPVPVFYYACEISAELTCARGYSIVSGLGMKDMYHHTETFKEETKKKLGRYYTSKDGQAGNLLLKTYAAKQAGIAEIRTHVLAASDYFQVKPRVIVIDHAETVKPNKRSKDHSDWRQQADIYTEARALGTEMGSIIIMPDRCNKETAQREVPDKTSFQGAFEKAGIVDVGIGLCQTPEERIANKIRYIVCVNRHGKEWGYYEGKVAEDKFQMSIDRPLEYEKEMKEAAERQAKLYGDRKSRRLNFKKELPKELGEEDR